MSSVRKDINRGAAPGATVAARIAHWRGMTWEELCELMTAVDKAAAPTAASLTAPAVRVPAVAEPAG